MLEQLSRGELRKLMELATRCLTATTPEQLASIISSIYGLLSYDKAALCALSVGDNEVSLAHYVNHSYGAPWAEAVVPAGRPGTAELLDAAEAFGLTDGVSFSCTGVSPAFRSLLSVAGVPADERARVRRVLAVIGPHLHEAYRRVLQLQAERAHDVDLSAREREVLSWAQQGKTYWEIGGILGISQRTVKFHVARIKAKLDVVSAGHAIAKAMRLGIIT